MLRAEEGHEAIGLLPVVASLTSMTDSAAPRLVYAEFVPNPAARYVYAVLCLGSVALVGWGCWSLLNTQLWEVLTERMPVWLVMVLGMLPITLVLLFWSCFQSASRGLPRLTVLSDGIEFETTSGKSWAKWSSLSPFWMELGGGYSLGGGRRAFATIIGTAASEDLLRAGQFVIQLDSFSEGQLPTIVRRINAQREIAVGSAPAEPETPTASSVPAVAFRH